MQKLILITGGAGFIGSQMANTLLKAGYRVRVLDNLTYGDAGVRPFLDKAGYEFMEGDIRHIEDVMAAMKGVHAVVNLAAIVGDAACDKDCDRTLAINYEATKVLLEIAKYSGVKRFLFASTCSVYGFQKDKVRETSALNPISLYAESKLQSEDVILKQGGGIDCTIFRLATVYGASDRMRFDLVLNTLTIRALAEQAINIFGGDQWRPLVHVQDVAAAFRLGIEAPREEVAGQIFNLGSDEQNFRVWQLAEAVEKRFPETKVEHQKTTTDNRSYAVSFEKIRKELGFTPTHTPADAMDEIEQLWKSGSIGDYKNDIYYNVNSL